MCKASKYLSQLESISTQIHNDFTTLKRKLSEYDKSISEHYHKIEQSNFNASEGFYLAKNLQEILRKRRILKDEYIRLHTLKQSLDNLKINQTINNAKVNISKAKKKSAQWQREWKYTYTLEEVLH